jgi:hypothetical protein
MSTEQERSGGPGGEQGMGVGAQAGTDGQFQGETQAALTNDNVGAVNLGAVADVLSEKPLKPLPHAVADYALGGMLLAAPWLFGFSRNRKATVNAVASGASVLALSLMTRYPLGVCKWVPFRVHGYIEAAAGALTAAAPWTLGFSRNRAATLTHVASGLATLAVFAVTDYDSPDQYRPLSEQAQEYLPEGAAGGGGGTAGE